ncbi:MAG: hypothetical protein GWM87_09350 [Xanthomonadales bacterium]|nr:phasin family protein [Xanthomonadales bacterium]NIX13114.1 hypothetical protein [Xanthomonadales bacterium]
MATKTMSKKVQANPVASKLTAPVIESAKDIFLAGIGALAIVQKEGGRLLEEGGKLFGRFVEEGARFEDRTRGMAEDAVSELRDGVETTVGTVRKQATDGINRLEDALGISVNDTLGRLGIPTTGDLNEVSTRVQKMSRQVNEGWKGLNRTVDDRVKSVLNRLEVPVAGDIRSLADNIQGVTREAAEGLAELEKRLEEGLEGKVTTILEGIGVPTREEIGKLAESVAELSKQIAALEKSAAAPSGKAG